MVRSPRRRLLGLVAALIAAGCLSPTLPLPPPHDPVVTGPDEAGVVRLQGTAPKQSVIFAYNRDSDLGWFQGAADGKYDLTVLANDGDLVLLWYEVDERSSLPLELVIGRR